VIRRIILVLAFLLLGAPALALFPPRGGGPNSGGGPSGLPATKTFINTSATAQPAGQPTKMFGMAFKDGDICSGSAPKFLDGSTAQPFSASVVGARTYWNSGCLRFASLMLRPTFSIVRNGSHNVTVTSGGTWPSASSRTLTEVYAQNLVINAPPGAPTDNNVSASLSSWLDNPALPDANNFEQVQWVDGDAGACWRITTKMAHAQAGTADVSMQASHYICGLNNSRGTLGGFRWLGVLRQPSFNFSGAPATRRTFATPSSGSPTTGVNWQANAHGGGTTTTPLVWPWAAQAFTVNTTTCNPVGSGIIGCGSTTATNNYYQGAGGLQVIPAYFTGGSLPSGITTNTTYFIGELQGDPNLFAVFTDGSGGAGSVINLGAGSGTVNPVVAIYPFGRIWMATKDGEYNFFQGSGSLTAETTLIDQQDQTYLQKTKVIPPYDLTLSGSSPSGLNSQAGGGVITDTSYPYDWNPYTIGTSQQGESAPGDHDDIGVVMADAVGDFYNQSFLSEKVLRIDSFAAGALPYDFKEDSSHQTIDFSNSGTYTGLVTRNAVSTDTFHNLCWGGVGTSTGYPGAAGFNHPATSQQATSMGISASFDHKPQFNPMAYIRTGELQHLDMLEDEAQQGILTECAWANPSTVSLSYPVGGILTGWDGIGAQFRQLGWQAVNQQWAAMLAPYDPTHPSNLNFDGTQTGAYFNEVADASANYPYDQLQAGATVYGSANSYVQANGMWTMVDLDFPDSTCSSNPCYQTDGPEWEKAFVHMAELLGVARGNTKAVSFLEAAPAVWWKHIGDTFGYWSLYHYYEEIGPYQCNTTHMSHTLNTSDSGFSISTSNSWVTGAPAWTNTAGGGPPYFVEPTTTNSLTLNNGDLVTIYCSYLFTNGNIYAPSVMSVNTPYYLVNVGSGHMDLTTVQSEALANNTAHRVVPTDTGPGGIVLSMLPYKTNAPAINAAAFMQETVAIIRTAAVWAKALGVDSGAGGFAAVEADANARFANTTGVCLSSPCGPGGRYPVGGNGGFYQGGGGTGTPIDPRYAVQNHFGP
jgi:hypothetical protein